MGLADGSASITGGAVAKGTMVELPAPQGSTFAYVMGMVHGRGRPGLVVLHDASGLTPHVRDVVNRFAQEGYDAMAPELTDEARALDDVATALEYLCEINARHRVGIIGFGLGGELALRAAHHQRVAAYISFHGVPPADALTASISAPGLILCGEQDTAMPMWRAVAFVQQQANAGISTEMAVYPRAGRDFFNDARPDAYQPVAARTAWSRTLALLNRRVKGVAAGAA